MIDFSAASDRLLGPLLDAAARTLRALPADEVPQAARRLLAFDRRGMSRGPARAQLRRALEGEESFREQVFAAYRARPEVQAVLDGWQRADALAVARAAAAAGGDELATLAGALIAAEPEGAELALGIVVALDAVQQLVDDDRDVNTEVAGRIAELEEKVRRADASRIAVEQARDELAEQLRAARASRREREARGVRELSRAARRITELEDEIERERTGAEEAKNVSARASERARARAARAEAASSRVLERAEALEAELQQLRNEIAASAIERAAATPVAPAPAKDRSTRRGSGRRARPNLPPGLFADSVSGADAMLRGRSVRLVVDGYNVSKCGWPGPSLEMERESLLRALQSLHLVSGTDVIVAFDGDDTQGVPLSKRTGVAVVFSEAGEEADSVVVEIVAKTPLAKPVVVASSDRWVREHAETFGAVVISAQTLVSVLRKAPGR